MKFGLIGDGHIAKYHKRAMEIHGHLIRIYDPLRYDIELDEFFKHHFDTVAICSPSYLHPAHISLCLDNNIETIIVEKPLRTPYFRIDVPKDANVNIVHQLRWGKFGHIRDIDVRFVRDENYWRGWRKDYTNIGGVFYHLFYHYVDLGIMHDCPVHMKLSNHGKQHRLINGQELSEHNMQVMYDAMYRDIFSGGGVKPHHLLELEKGLDELTEKFPRNVRQLSTGWGKL